MTSPISYLKQWLPDGHVEGGDYVALNPTRRDRNKGSFRINHHTGAWIDHATSDKGGDITSLYAYLFCSGNHQKARSALNSREFRYQTRLKDVKIKKPLDSKRRDTITYAYQLWQQGQPIIGTYADQYLHARGINLPDGITSLRYHRNLWCSDIGEYTHALIAAVCDENRVFKALHRTYLERGEAEKLNILNNKKMLGPVSGGAVHFGTIENTIAVAEGIETALSFHATTGTTTWACLSTSGLKAIRLPSLPAAENVIIVADNDENGSGIIAARTLCKRLIKEHRTVKVLRTRQHGDFNDLIQTMKGL